MFEPRWLAADSHRRRSEEHTSELQSHVNLVCRLLLEKKKNNKRSTLGSKKTKSVICLSHFFHVFFDFFFVFFFFFFNDTATTEIYTLSLHDALPIFAADSHRR